jgi:hypothetical protein
MFKQPPARVLTQLDRENIMTTRVTVEANHGWPVRVTATDPKTGKPWPEVIVPAAEKMDFYVHYNMDLIIHEVQPTEDDVEPKMSFGGAVEHLKRGGRVAREGWNGKGMYLFLVPGSRFKVNREPLLSILGEGTEVDYHAYIDMKTAQGYVVPWLASQVDILSNDWVAA